MKRGELALLMSESESYIINCEDDFNTRSGMIYAKDLLKKKFGDKVKTHLGKEFLVIRPTIMDLIGKKIKRTAQVILPKDIALILAYTGINSDGFVVDAGTGSGYLAIFLANFLSRGKVVTYENKKEFFDTAKRNIKFSGLKNIFIKRKDVTKGIGEKNVDLITLDLQNAKVAIKHAHRSLRAGGWLMVYSPTVEHLTSVVKEIKKKGFSQMKTVENIVREWQTERTIRPKTVGLMHTGWLTFARKLR